MVRQSIGLSIIRPCLDIQVISENCQKSEAQCNTITYKVRGVGKEERSYDSFTSERTPRIDMATITNRTSFVKRDG